jgi:hypothetical protein
MRTVVLIIQLCTIVLLLVALVGMSQALRELITWRDQEREYHRQWMEDRHAEMREASHE